MDNTPLSALPGYKLAAHYFNDDAKSRQDIKDILDSLDSDTPRPASRLHEALDMLLIMQFAQAMAARNISRIKLQPALLQVLQLPDKRSAKRLKRVIKHMPDAFLEIAPSYRSSYNVLFQGSEPKASFDDRVADAVLRAEPALILLPPDHALATDLTLCVSQTFSVRPPNHNMLRAVLQIMHDTEAPLADMPDDHDRDDPLIGLSEFHLLNIMCAPDMPAALARLEQLHAKRPRQHKTATLNAVHGHHHAKAEFLQLCDDLTDWQAGRVDWSDVTSTFLLYGPPGTGKSFLAAALAGSAKLPFIKTSYSDCQRAGHQGDMLRALHNAANQAIAASPAVFFIDEIDSFYSRGSSSGQQSKYIYGVVNGLLTLLDELNRTAGVIVIAATNHRDEVDPAILRDGRFDSHIEIGPLDRDGVQSFLKEELPRDTLSTAQMAQLGDQLSGQTGAKLANLMRRARTSARKNREDLHAGHIMAAASALIPPKSPDFMRRVAMHEAAHLIIGHLCHLPLPYSAEINASGGRVHRPGVMFLTPDVIDTLIATSLAGYAAERIAFGAAAHGSGGLAKDCDLAMATRYALEAELCYGFGETLIWQRPPASTKHLEPALRARIEARLQKGQAKAESLLHQHRAALEQIADTLLAQRSLTAPELADLLTSIKPATPPSHPTPTAPLHTPSFS